MKKLFLFLALITMASFLTAKNTAPSNSKQTLQTALSSIDQEISKNQEAVTKNAAVQLKSKNSFIDLKEVFSASPVIYSILFCMSVTALVILFYNSLNFRPKHLMNQKHIDHLKKHLYQEKYQEVLIHCEKNNNLLASMLSAGVEARKHGPQYMIDSMKDEGRRVTAEFWQKLSLLNDIAVIAPMLGLSGTVIGMFYAFYDINRSIDSIAALFDGLGIAVGTTVVGLIVSILAMIFHTTLKYRMTRSLHFVESEAASLANLIKSTKD